MAQERHLREHNDIPGTSPDVQPILDLPLTNTYLSFLRNMLTSDTTDTKLQLAQEQGILGKEKNMQYPIPHPREFNAALEHFLAENPQLTFHPTAKLMGPIHYIYRAIKPIAYGRNRIVVEENQAFPIPSLFTVLNTFRHGKEDGAYFVPPIPVANFQSLPDIPA